MTVVQINTTPVSTDDAAFRLWGKDLSDAIAACGMVKTADTGQINWASVLRPAGATTAAGYEIWRFNDAAQSAFPIFIKLEYGTATAATIPSFWITVGTGSDGAGNITGSRHARTQIARGSSSSTVPSWISSGDGYFAVLFAGAGVASGATIPLVIERLRAVDGTVDTNTASAGFLVAYFGSNALFNVYAHDGSGSDTPGLGGAIWPVLTPTGFGTVVNSGQYKGTTYAYPVYPLLGYPRGPARAVSICYTGDAAGGTAFTTSLYGAAHVFRSTGVSISLLTRANNNTTIAVRAE